MTRIYTTTFAATGDKETLAATDPGTGKVSLPSGWTPDYEKLDTDPSYRPVGRKEMNGVINEVTAAVGELQQYGFAPWQALTGGWPLNARVVSGGIVYKSTAAANTAVPPAAPWVMDAAADINSAPAKPVLADADELGVTDSANSFGLVKVTWANLKGQLAGTRNKIINGGMAVAQRGNAVLSNNSIVYGGADRWMTGLFNFTTAAGTVGQLAGQPVTSSSTGFMHSLSSLTTTGAGLVHFRQRIEAVNAFGLNGKTVTVSGNVAQDTGATQSLTVRLNKANSTDNFGATTLIANSTTTTVASGVLTKFTATFNLAETDASSGLELVLEYAGVGALTSKSFYLGDVQLEPGSVATTFEHRPYGMELALCQRYFYVIQSSIGCFSYSSASNINSMVYSFVQLPVPFRAGPTASATAPLRIDNPSVNNYTQTTAQAGAALAENKHSILITLANFTGLPYGTMFALRSDGGYIRLSSEL